MIEHGKDYQNITVNYAWIKQLDRIIVYGLSPHDFVLLFKDADGFLSPDDKSPDLSHILIKNEKDIE